MAKTSNKVFACKKLENCSAEELIERFRRQVDRADAVREQVKALEKKIVSERAGRRVANKRADEAEAKLKAISALFSDRDLG